eukprot:5052860-Amphidinium_carterae.1
MKVFSKKTYNHRRQFIPQFSVLWKVLARCKIKELVEDLFITALSIKKLVPTPGRSPSRTAGSAIVEDPAFRIEAWDAEHGGDHGCTKTFQVLDVRLRKGHHLESIVHGGKGSHTWKVQTLSQRKLRTKSMR